MWMALESRYQARDTATITILRNKLRELNLKDNGDLEACRKELNVLFLEPGSAGKVYSEAELGNNSNAGNPFLNYLSLRY